MTSFAFPLTASPRAARELASIAWWFALALLAFASVLPLRLIEHHGSAALHWIHCAALVAALAALAAIVIRARVRSSRAKEKSVDLPAGGGWSPDLHARESSILPKPEVLRALEEPDQSKLLAWVAAERQTGATLAYLRVFHRLRDPLHHAGMIVRDLEAIGGPPDRVILVRSLRAHLDEISGAVGGHDARASLTARLEVVCSMSDEAIS